MPKPYCTYEEIVERCKSVLDTGLWREGHGLAAMWLHRELERSLAEIARAVYPDVGVHQLGGRRGRVDLLVVGEVLVGIELDNLSPRAKSIEKLQLMRVERRVICLRGPAWEGTLPRGIDAILKPCSKPTWGISCSVEG